jgi:hypothetical protein
MLLLAAAFQEDTYPSSGSGGLIGALFGGVFFLIWLAVVLVFVVSFWKIFTKAGKPGWAAIVPIYNWIVLLEIVGRPLWWIAMLIFLPCVNVVILVIVLIDLGKAFGKGPLEGIVFPMLAFGDARYVGPVAGTPARV